MRHHLPGYADGYWTIAPVKSRSVINEEELVGKCDERRVREVYAGRMISKPTRPRPVYTPSRKRAERGTMTDQQEKEKDSESDVDEVTVVMKSEGKKRIKLKLPGGELKLDLEMKPY